MRKQISIIILILLLFSSFPLAQAQQPVAPIAYGETVSGSIVNPQTDIFYYSFTGNAGDVILVETNSPDTDTYAGVLDASGTILAQNDDISSDNLNALVKFQLPAPGTYQIGVAAYNPGTFSLTLTLTDTVDMAPPPTAETHTGAINNETPSAEYKVSLVAGQRIMVNVEATSGDLDTFLYLTDLQYNALEENDDVSNGNLNSALEYDVETSGDYLVIVTRYGELEGTSSGDYTLTINVGIATANAPNGTIGVPDPVASGYPAIVPQPVAEWTILTYMAGDNNLEDSAIVDMDELEIAGGSDGIVRVIALLDRSPDYGTSNGDWEGVRVYEMGPDSGQMDMTGEYPMPLLDTPALFDLGQINSGIGITFTEFLIWGIQTYPAEHYAIEINDHGGGWTGMAGDDTAGDYISLPQYTQAFKTAAEVAGIERFDLLINDACLMSNFEYFVAIAPYFDYTLGAAESMYPPGFDLTMLIDKLRSGATFPELGVEIVDSYMNIMEQAGFAADQTPTLVDLRNYDAVQKAVEDFANLIKANPSLYTATLGEARYNTYNYAANSYLDPHIDLGDLMIQLQRVSKDEALLAATQNVLDALNSTLVYGRRGSAVPGTAQLQSIYFPLSADSYMNEYEDINTVTIWTDFLSSYYGTLNTAVRFSGIPGTEVPTAPEVAITNVYPPVTDPVSITAPALISMEVVGRNIAKGTFTVDQVQPDGSLRRVDSSDILTFAALEDGTFDYLNLWDSGVNDFDYFWNPTLYVVSDGSTQNFELVESVDGITSLTARYRNAADDPWAEVVVYFEDGVANRAVGSVGDNPLGPVVLRVGSELQVYNALVTPDGRVQQEPGTTYIVPETGLQLEVLPAPSGEYQLGFLVEVYGGETGFSATRMTVNHDAVDTSLVGSTDLSLGFTIKYPADWSNFERFPGRDYFATGNPAGNQFIYVYPVYDATDTASTIDSFIARYESTLTAEPTTISAGGQDVQQFSFSAVVNGTTYTGTAFAYYNPDTEVGLVFSSESTDGSDVSAVFQSLTQNVTFLDFNAIDSSDTGLWSWDAASEDTYYPVPEAWLPGAGSAMGWVYTPDNAADSPVFAEVSVFGAGQKDALTVLNDILAQTVSIQEGYALERIETYYGENHTWEGAYYTYGGIVGRLFVMVENGTPYIMRFEAPADQANATFRTVFEPMLDGFRVDPVTE